MNYFGIPRNLYQFLSYEERPNYEYGKQVILKEPRFIREEKLEPLF